MQKLNLRNVLCATGLLPQSEIVVATAARLANHLNAGLDVLHVITNNSPSNNRAEWRGVLPPPAMCESLVTRMRDVVARTSFPIGAARVSLRAGSPAAQIVHRSTEVDADLVVIGRSGDGERGTSPGALRSAIPPAKRRPILVVPNSGIAAHAQQAWGPFTQIVYAVDASGTCDRMMELALALAHRGAGVSLLSAYGSRAHHILGAANSRNADLIIIGEATSDSGRRTLRRVLHDARCPVLIVDSSGSHATPTLNPLAHAHSSSGESISI